MATFMFPEHGSPRPGMGRPWLDHPSWRVVSAVSGATRRDVGHLLVSAGSDELGQIGNAHLATLTLSLIILDAVRDLGVTPTACAGYGFGEFGALIAAEALSLRDGVSIVTNCTKAIEAADHAEPGRTTTVFGLVDDAAEQACHRAGGAAWVAAYNAPGNVVIAGDDWSVESAVYEAYSLGAEQVLPGPAGGALHTPLVAPARDRLVRALHAASWAEPSVPVVANLDAAAHGGAGEWPALLARGLTSPIRWHHSLTRLARLGEDVFVELGPGGLLAGLAAEVLPGAATVAVAAPCDLDRLRDVVGVVAVSTDPAGHHGEHLYVSERLVISPCAGIFHPAPPARPLLDVGTVLGHAGDQEVRSAFAGHLMGMLALPGERVRPGQPIAWLRAS